MKYIKRHYIFSLLFITFILLISAFNVSGIPTVGNTTVKPAEPTLKSQVTITAVITGENITDVVLYVEECSSVLQTCFETHKTNMTKTDDNVYTGTVTLTRDETTYITYYFDITDDSGETTIQNSTAWVVNLKLDEENDNNGGTSNTGGDKGTPGFEILLVLTALFVFVLYYKIKR